MAPEGLLAEVPWLQQARPGGAGFARLTLEPQEVEASAIAELRAAGVDDVAIYEAMYVCFVFNVIDRLADAFGYIVRGSEHQHRTARVLVLFGYWAAALPD